jgi:hypothetical protein
MSKAKAALWALVLLAVALGAGWLWGSWGRWGLERQLRIATVHAQLATASAALAGARVDIAELNYGQAGGKIERAKKVMEGALGGLDDAGFGEATAPLKDAVAKAADAQQLTARADQSATARIAESLKALTRAIDTPAK